MKALTAWAESLAERGHVTPSEVRLLVETCQKSAHVVPAAARADAVSTDVGSLADPAAAGSQAAGTPGDRYNISRFQTLPYGFEPVVEAGEEAAETNVAAVLPLCIFLRRSGPQYAGEIFPHVIACLRSLHSSHSRQLLTAQRWQLLFTQLFAQLHGVLRMEGLAERMKVELSSEVASLLKRWLQRYKQKGQRTGADVAMMTGFKRAVREHRHPLPLLPQDAAELLRYVADDFLARKESLSPSRSASTEGGQRGSSTGEEGLFMDDTALALGRHWSDDTALAFAGRLVALAQAGGGLDPDVGLRIISSSCGGLKEALAPLLDCLDGSPAKPPPPGTAGATSEGLQLPSISFVAATARLACDLAVDLWVPDQATLESKGAKSSAGSVSTLSKKFGPASPQGPPPLPTVTSPAKEGTASNGSGPIRPSSTSVASPRSAKLRSGTRTDTAETPDEIRTADGPEIDARSTSDRTIAYLRTLSMKSALGNGYVPDGASASPSSRERGLPAHAVPSGDRAWPNQAMWENTPAQQRLTEVGNLMLDVAEACLAYSWMTRHEDTDSEKVLRLGAATIRAASGLAISAAASAASANLDAVARVRLAMASAARLAELELGPPHTLPPSSRVLRWQLERPLTDAEGAGDGPQPPALELSRALAEALCQVLAKCWRAGLESVVRASFVLFTDFTTYSEAGSTPTEAQVLVLTLGRLAVLLEGEQAFLGWILPLLQDADLTAAPPQVPACMMHVLSTLAGVAAHADSWWAYEKILALMSVVYKSARTAPWMYLMYRSSTTLTGCPGAVATAFLHLAQQLKGASLKYRQDYRAKLLTLFADMGGLAPPDEDSWGWDLGALLPAVAAIGQLLSTESHQKRLLSRTLSYGLTFEALVQLQEQDVALVKLFRLLWMYISLYKFAGVGHSRERYAWDPTWRSVVGTIAVTTPPIVVSSGASVDGEKLESELGERLANMGRRGRAPAVAASLMALVRPRAGAVAVPTNSAARNAHLLATAILNLARVETSPLPAEGDITPLSPLIAVQQAVQGGWLGPWLAAITERCFDIYVLRLRGELPTGDSGKRDDAQGLERCQEGLGMLLARNLGSLAVASEVQALSAGLLNRLLDSLPGLYWNPHLMQVLLETLDEEESSQFIRRTNGKSSSVMDMILTVVERGAAAAPGSTEALMQESLRAGNTRAGAAALRHAPAILSAIERGSARFCMSNLHVGANGIESLNRKAHYGGIAAGLAESGTMRKKSSQELPVPDQAMAELQDALQVGTPHSVLEDRYLTVAAALIADADSPARHRLIRLIAWLPAHSLTPSIMRLSIFVWFWTVAAAPSLQVPLVMEVASAWEWTVQNRLGLFNNRFDADTYQLSKGGGPDDDQASIDAISAHHLWLSFWLETWQVLGSGTGPVASALLNIMKYTVSVSLQDATVLTSHPAAAGARFRLLQLALLVARYHQSSKGFGGSDFKEQRQLTAGILYQRVLKGALLWFAGPVPWYGRFSPAEAREEAAAVEDFGRLVEVSQRDWPEPTVPVPHIATPPLPALTASLATGHDPLHVSPGPPGTLDPVLGATLGTHQDRLSLLSLLLKYEAERLQVWADPLGISPTVINPYAGLGPQVWRNHTRTAWGVSPHLALSLLDRFPTVGAVRLELEALLVGERASQTLQRIPRAAELLARATADLGPSAHPLLTLLQLWAPAPLLQALEMMGGPAGNLTQVRAYALRSLQACSSEEVVFFLPQLVQLLRGDESGQIRDYLLSAASRSVLYAHILICCLKAEGTPPEEAFNPTVKRSGWQPPSDTGLWSAADQVCQQVWQVLAEDKMARLKAELDFFDSVTSISGKLYPVPRDERKAAAVRLASQLEVEREDLYLPTNPQSRLVAVVGDSATPMQSAAKVPILVGFKVEDGRSGGMEKVQSCIFKVGDDCRQDVLALQVIGLLKDAWRKAGLELYLAPYGVIPTGYECGIIEVVPRCKSRSALGETTDGGLYDIWRREFGAPGSARFEAARHNFIISEAGYAVACFLLQAKDRHNGNIMIDADGHLVHIDFGFILGISPGGNLGFETAAFKLSHEMTQLLDPGGTRASPHFRLFEEMCIRAYLVARAKAEAIIATVSLMAESGLPCYGYGKPLQSLRERFHLEMTDAQAAAFMRNAISDAYDKWTTGFYDYVQYLQNRIPK